MARIKYFVFLMGILLMTTCDKTNYPSSLILGEWQLIEIYGPLLSGTEGWFIIQGSPIQTIKFSPNGEYAIAVDGKTTCNGTFALETDKKLSLNPNGCMPLVKSVETIFKLTHDTLIISNTSSSISSYNLRQDKYIRK
jgi:hypothetical protein